VVFQKICVSRKSLRPRRGGPAESHREYYVGGGFLREPALPGWPRTHGSPRNNAATRADRDPRVPTVSPVANASSSWGFLFHVSRGGRVLGDATCYLVW
jgi:hypothetical protein